jgi:hypothetical protein
MIEDLRFMISRRTTPARNFTGEGSPRGSQFNAPWNTTAISRPFKSSIINHQS